MKKFFAIYTTLVLDDKPEWFDEFRKKYDEFEYEPHITLAQPCFINNEDVDILKENVLKFIKNNELTSTCLTFNTLFLDRQDEKEDGCIMIESINCKELLAFQKNLNLVLADFKEYTDPIYQNYELNFRPHITIGRDLNNQRFTEAVANLPETIKINATFPEAILAIVNDTSAKERNNPNNLTHFKLQ